ncbi:MAG: hypothetical protein ABIH86_03875 [Planctomycetota bacterium]
MRPCLSLIILFFVAAAPVSAISITAPNGGETFVVPYGAATATTTIQWTGATGTVSIEASVDGGLNWRLIATSNTSNSVWNYAAATIDDAPLRSRNVLLRVSASAQTDITNGVFSVIDEFEPTVSEQHIIHLINRGRQNPVAEGTRYASSDGYDILAGTSNDADADKQQPLMWNPILTKTSRMYSEFQWVNDLDLDHNHLTDFNNDTVNETNASQRNAANGYTGNGVWENIGCSSVARTSDYFHTGFINDWNGPTPVSNRGHRLACLSMTPNSRYMFEIGIGNYISTTANGEGWRHFITENFGVVWTRPADQTGNRRVYIVGMVFDDINDNGSCEEGEGLGSVKIQAYQDDTPVGSPAYSRAAGGYQLTVPLALWGTLTVKASGGGLGNYTVEIANVTVPVVYIADDNDDSAPGANSTTTDDVLYNGNEWVMFRKQDGTEQSSSAFTPVIAVSGSPVTTVSGGWELLIPFGGSLDGLTFTATDSDGATDTVSLSVSLQPLISDYSGTLPAVNGSPASGPASSPVSVTLGGAIDGYGWLVYRVPASDSVGNSASGFLTVRILTTVSGTVLLTPSDFPAANVQAILYQNGVRVPGVSSVSLSATAGGGVYLFDSVPAGTGYSIGFVSDGKELTPSSTATFSVSGPTTAPGVSVSVKKKSENSSFCSSGSTLFLSPAAPVGLLLFVLFALKNRRRWVYSSSSRKPLAFF